MRTKFFTRTLAVLLGLVASAVIAGPAFADDGLTTMPKYGYIEVCKAASPGISGAFQFKVWSPGVDGVTLIKVNAGECTPPTKIQLNSLEQAVVQEVDSFWTDRFGVETTADAWHHGFGYKSSEYSEVSAIHTLAPGGTDDAIVDDSVDLADRSVVVQVTPVFPGDTSKDTIVQFTNDPLQGYVEICKAQNTDAGLDGQTFRYEIVGAMGYDETVTVPMGACSTPQYVPAGHVNIRELDDPFVTDISVAPDGRWYDAWDDQVEVEIVPAALGFTASESVVTFTDNSSMLKICKATPDKDLAGTSFAFDVNGTPYSVTAGFVPDEDAVMSIDGYRWSASAHCVLAGRYRTGTKIVLTEKPMVGVGIHMIKDWKGNLVQDIQADPWYYKLDKLFVRGGDDFTGNTATFNILPGVTTVTFTNEIKDPGSLKICKLGAGSGMATFTVAGPRFKLDEHGLPLTRDIADIAPGSDTVKVPVGSCSYVLPNYPYAGVQTITETLASGLVVSKIDVGDGRLALGPDLAHASVGAYIGVGPTVVTFTNGTAPDDPPSTSTGGSGGSGTSTPAPAVTTSSAGQQAGSVVQATAGAQAPKVVAKIKVQLGVVKIVKIGSHRYVVLKVTSPKATAKVHLRLIGKTGIVLKNADRIVKTNKLVTIKTLPLSKSVAKVRATVVK